jgi:hypothetical protein
VAELFSAAKSRILMIGFYVRHKGRALQAFDIVSSLRLPAAFEGDEGVETPGADVL